ncbi:hypothetical protein VIBNISO65_830026 [Vibrio nigripulchritudo SO65]|uniref:AHH domain-containing protein n=1 Tax=Vibrio nigripulchritudo TaxID=28173 RepID=UPI0003B1DD3F|nr:AHH domain-containing protein [Vibrio nigripulchritudo]CCN38214.1 hypothetical protein VIBNIAM115_840026 [Vibrio nigripulchritudo AM115]CCN42692.1 hypothetical protein VIBNIFTn2_360026 [Vibrio nigripulchritudo FTn2]CCN79088.1 hypothetical protein VIBNISO65_830026 [Vibrio nigripulchritudo SO65]
MQKTTREHYVTVQELEEDLTAITGNRQLAKAQAKQFSIRYKGEVIDAVRYKKGLISEEDLLLSRHVRWQHAKNHSKRLAENMAAAGRKRSPNTAAHHIVSWDHKRAARSRLRLAAFGIDIDHEANGVYLPRFKKHIPHKAMPNAKAHSVTHTNQYYLNVEFLIQDTIAEGLGKQGIIDTLREIGEELESGDFPLTQSIQDQF